MSDLDGFDQDVEADEAPEQAPVAEEAQLPEWAQKQLAEARKEAQGLRTRLRRTELTSEYGADVLELVPESLPLKEQKDLAAKLAERLRKQETDTSTEPAKEEAPEEEPTPAEQALAAVTKGPSSGTSSLPSDMTAKEILELGKKDPAAATRLIEAKYRTP